MVRCDNCKECNHWCYQAGDTREGLCCVCRIKKKGKEFSGCCACSERVVKLVKHLSCQMDLTKFIPMIVVK